MRELTEWIRNRGGIVTAREVQQGRRSIKTAEHAELALQNLIDVGYGDWIPSEPGKPGQPTRRFQLRDPVYVYGNTPRSKQKRQYRRRRRCRRSKTHNETDRDMTLNMIQSMADSNGITLDVDGDCIVLEGPAEQVDELATTIRQWKPELIKVLQGQTVGNVGTCDCGSALLGLPTFDGFVNRVCPDCGRWHRCQVDPYHGWTDADLSELLNERTAIIQHDGQIDPADAEKMAVHWLESEIGEKRTHRTASNARSLVDATQDTPQKTVSKFASIATNDISKWLPDARTPDSLSTQLNRS